MSMRIRGAKTELEEAGESTDGMAESTATLRAEIKALSGIDIMLNDTTFKSTYQIMDELSKKWGDLSDIAQATIIELVAGKHQGNVMSSLMSNFDTARNALETSLNSSGSAMKEHAKWSESLEARLNKLKATWQSLSQTFMNSDFLKVGIDLITGFVDILDKLIDKLGSFGTIGVGVGIWGILSKLSAVTKDSGGLGSLRNITSILSAFGSAFPKAADGIKIFTDSLKKAIVTGALANTLNEGTSAVTLFGQAAIVGKGAIKGLWAVIAAHPILATVAAIGIAVVAIDKFTESADELAERIEDVTSKYKEQHDSLMKLKGDYDTSNEESMISKYEKLSKGVNSLGENVSLTADEYSEYQSIVNTIANQIPSLVTGYNSQGDAILSCADNVKTLAEEYKKLIIAENDAVLENGSDIFKDFNNDIRGTLPLSLRNDDNVEPLAHLEKFEELLSLSEDDLDDYIENNINPMDARLISEMLDENGIKRDVMFGDGLTDVSYESYEQHIKRAIKESVSNVKTILDEASADINTYAEDLGVVTEAYLSTAFLGGDDKGIDDYSHLSDRMQNIINQVASNFDSEFYAQFLDDENPYESLTKYFNDMLSAFDNLSDTDAKQFEAAFDLQTKFNGGEISYGEYVHSIQDAGSLIDDLVNNGGLDEEVANQIKLTLNTDEVTKNYDVLKERLTSDEYNIKMKSDEAEEFLDGLTSSEYQVAIDLMMSGEVDLSDFDIESLREYIEKQAKINEAMNYTIAIDVEAESIETLNTAMAESVSGAGLSSEAIAALKSRYAELESEGYNLSAMFEETANGIHINREAISKLEQKLASDKLAETDKQLGVLKNRYDELTTEIDKCRDAGDRAALYTEQQSIIEKINDLATLASQYEGLTSAYNAWIAAEEAGSERDMYEKVIEGFETVGDEISRGWVDDGTIKFLELLTGKTGLAGKSGKDLKKIYDDLDDTIKNTTYSIRDFFTVDEDGNSTNTGVYNFLDAVGQLEEEKFGGKDVVKRNKDGNIIGFDFEIAAEKDENGNVIKNGDQVIAEALGISEELVQIMVRAADDAGFVVNLEGAYTQLADLKTEAESARDTLISLKNKGLKELGGVDVNFDLDAEGNDLVAEQGKAVELLNKFKKDGKIDLKMKGAQQALDIAEYLTIKLDDLTEPKFMQIDTSEIEEDLRDPIEKIQEIGQLCKEKHLVTLTGDTKELKEVQGEIDEVAKEIEELDPEVKAQIGIDENWDAKTIADKIEKGEIEIPAELELDVQMSDDLKDMRLMMMNQLGLASDNEVKLKIGYDIDDSVVDSLTDEEKEVVVKYLAEHDEVDSYTPEQKEALVKYLADGGNLDSYTPEEKQSIVKYLADGGNIEDYTPEEKQAIVEYLTDSGDPDSWTPEQKEAVAKFKTDSAEVDNYSPEDKQAIAKFIKDSSEPDKYQPPDKTQEVVANLDSSEPDNYQPADKKFTVKAILQKVGDWANKLLSGGSTRKVVNGTANVNGTAFVGGTTGKAFKHGDWSTKDSGEALVGELGTETLVRNGRYYTIGDTGAEFIHYEKGDIIFNHKICGIV